jgi:serine/threonine-protein kinase HipA
MALTLNGSTEWPSGKDLLRFAEARSLGSPRILKSILEQIGDALSETGSAIEISMKSNPAFKEIGSRIHSEWKNGILAITSRSV